MLSRFRGRKTHLVGKLGKILVHTHYIIVTVLDIENKKQIINIPTLRESIVY